MSAAAIVCSQADGLQKDSISQFWIFRDTFPFSASSQTIFF